MKLPLGIYKDLLQKSNLALRQEKEVKWPFWNFNLELHCVTCDTHRHTTHTHTLNFPVFSKAPKPMTSVYRPHHHSPPHHLLSGKKMVVRCWIWFFFPSFTVRGEVTNPLVKSIQCLSMSDVKWCTVSQFGWFCVLLCFADFYMEI